MPDAVINGVRLAYDDTGGDGIPIVALHGGPGMGNRVGNWRVFTALAQRLGTDRFRVVAYDHRGCGESDDGAPYTHDQWCDDLDQLRRRLGLGKIVLAGGSYGGMLALEYALRHQESLYALVLRDTVANGRYHGVAKQRAMASGFPMDEAELDRLFAGRTTSNDDFRALLRMIMPLYNVTRDPERDARAVAAMQLHYQTHNWAFARNQATYDVLERLPRITVPTLVTAGRHDWVTPLEANEEVARAIPNAELVVFENSGHAPQEEERERWLDVVAEFLERHVAGHAAKRSAQRGGAPA